MLAEKEGPEAPGGGEETGVVPFSAESPTLGGSSREALSGQNKNKSWILALGWREFTRPRVGELQAASAGAEQRPPWGPETPPPGRPPRRAPAVVTEDQRGVPTAASSVTAPSGKDPNVHPQ